MPDISSRGVTVRISTAAKQIVETAATAQQRKHDYQHGSPQGKKNAFNLLHTNGYLRFVCRNVSTKAKSADSKQAQNHCQLSFVEP